MQEKFIKEPGQIHSGVCSGPAAAYLSLAYDLYMLRHHSLLEAHLVERIKNRRQFQGARYELYVSATFIKAGIEIRLEDEKDRSQSHCEFLAIPKKTDKLYSVEAKSRHREGILCQPGARKNEAQIRLRIGRLLRSALAKQAHGTRIIFIDVNMPPTASSPFTSNWFRPLAQEIEKVENDTINGKPSPPAYIFVTNHPYHYVGDHEPDPAKSFMLTAINVPDFKQETNELRHIDPAIAELWVSVNQNVRVPHTFDE